MWLTFIPKLFVLGVILAVIMVWESTATVWQFIKGVSSRQEAWDNPQKIQRPAQVFARDEKTKHRSTL
jgi:hypothetical protein